MEGDVGNYWRTLYKLEKGFSQVPNALKIAKLVKTKVESFKSHIPMVQVETVKNSLSSGIYDVDYGHYRQKNKE